MNGLLTFEKCRLVRRCKLLFNIEWVHVANRAVSHSNQKDSVFPLLKFVIEDANSFLNSMLPVLCYFRQKPRFHSWVFVYHTKPQRDSKLDRLFSEDCKWDADKIVDYSALVCLRPTQKSRGPP